MLRRVIPILALVAASLSFAAPASAESRITGTTYPLYDGCGDYLFGYSGYLSGAASWDFEAELIAPSGDVSSSFYDYGNGSSFNWAGDFYVCAYEGIGRYRINGVTTWTDYDYYDMGWEPSYGTLTFRRQYTRSALAVSDVTPRFNSVVRYRVRSTQETRSGWAANAYEKVAVERRCGTGVQWRRVTSAWTNAYGNAVMSKRWDTRATCVVRAVTLQTTNSATSRSGTVKVNPYG